MCPKAKLWPESLAPSWSQVDSAGKPGYKVPWDPVPSHLLEQQAEEPFVWPVSPTPTSRAPAPWVVSHALHSHGHSGLGTLSLWSLESCLGPFAQGKAHLSKPFLRLLGHWLYSLPQPSLAPGAGAHRPVLNPALRVGH